MQDKRKIRLFLGISVFCLAVFIGLLITTMINFMNSATQTSQSETQVQTSDTMNVQGTIESTEQHYIESTEASQNESTQTESSTESEIVSTDSAELLRKFFSVYFTWELEEKSVTDRAGLLKDFMSEDLYEQKSIEADSEIFKELIQTYQETKEINTSNSMQLVSSRYLSSQIYQDTADINLYKVTVRLEQKAPYQEVSFMSEKSFHIRLLGDNITEMSEIKDSTRSEASESE